MTRDEEKRQHHRIDMAYPIRLFTRGGEQLAASETVNISQGGTLFVLPADRLPGLDQTVNVTISMPETSYQSDKVVDFACQADVVRRNDARGDTRAAVALAFSRPLEFTARI